MERLAGLNFRDFRGYKEYRKSFPVNIMVHKYLLYYTNNMHFWPRQHGSISTKTSVGLKLRTFSPANLFMSTVVLCARPFLLFVFGVKKIPDKKVWHTRQDVNVTITGSVGQQHNSKRAVISKQCHTQSS